MNFEPLCKLKAENKHGLPDSLFHGSEEDKARLKYALIKMHMKEFHLDF